MDKSQRLASVEWLQYAYADRGIEIGKDDNGEFLIVRNKKKFFKEKFEVFKETAKELANVSLEDFAAECIEVSFDVFQLKCAYEERYGFYFVTEDCSYARPFDYFVKEYAEKDKKYYIGSAFDYHC